jgi:hypothetical protein
MLLVVTARPEVQPPWAARPHVSVQLLSGWIVQWLLPSSVRSPEARNCRKRSSIGFVAHADGIPLFIEELTKTVLDTGFYVRRRARLACELTFGRRGSGRPCALR